MLNYRIGAVAARQITEILIRSTLDHGQRGADNYQLLPEFAMEDVAARPDRPGAEP
jgi:hypothetical protein